MFIYKYFFFWIFRGNLTKYNGVEKGVIKSEKIVVKRPFKPNNVN